MARRQQKKTLKKPSGLHTTKRTSTSRAILRREDHARSRREERHRRLGWTTRSSESPKFQPTEEMGCHRHDRHHDLRSLLRQLDLFNSHASHREEFGVSNEVMILGVTVYVLGLACELMIWGPMSEATGRKLPYMTGLLGSIAFQAPIAVASNVRPILVCRFLAGAFGSSTLAITAGMYVDFWDTVTRGQATMFFAAAIFPGPALGLVVREYTNRNESLGWRWTVWFSMIMGAASLISSLFIVPETLAPVPFQQRAAKLRVSTRNWARHSKLDENPVTLHALVVKYLHKPLKMLVQQPIPIVITSYMSLVYGILYLTFVAYPSALRWIAVYHSVRLRCRSWLCSPKWRSAVLEWPGRLPLSPNRSLRKPGIWFQKSV